jgi:DNA polymerase-3 subunit delta'
VRRVNETIRYVPGEARRRVYIFTEANFMKEAANALLKVLEEPPAFATLFLLAENAGALLPTIRSRSVTFTLAPLPVEKIEQDLAKTKPQWSPKQRALVARLSKGALGRARGFDLERYIASRSDALAILNSAIQGGNHTALFQVTETYRAGAEGRDKTEQLLGTLYSLLEDMMFLQSGVPDLVRNTDILGELKKLAAAVDFAWIAAATERANEVQYGMRRNLMRSLSLDALATALEK